MAATTGLPADPTTTPEGSPSRPDGSDSDAPRPHGLGKVVQPQSAITLVEGSTFCVCRLDGDIEPRQAQGLFVRDTRLISRWELRLDGVAVEPLSVVPAEPYECTFVGRAAPRPGLPEGTIIVEQRRLVGQGMREDVTLHNYGPETAAVDVSLTVEADFADLFLVKERRWTGLPPIGHRHVGGDLLFWIERPGADRGVRVSASDAQSAPHLLRFRAVVAPRGVWTASIDVVPSVAGEELETVYPADRPIEEATPARRMQGWHEGSPQLSVENTVLGEALRTSERDLGALRITDAGHPHDDVVAAGAPWFMALFGRDSLITSWMMLPFAPDLALGTLRTLARLQGTRDDPRTDEQPGRILHEVRVGADLSLSIGGSSVYYGTIDATPLFVMLVGRALKWGVDRDELRRLRPAVERALDWIENYGDRDGDGFVEYQRGTDRGLANQGWKDSLDAVTNRSGTRARPPIALAEVQGYCYAAMRAAEDLFAAWDVPVEASRWKERAARLQKRFDEAFWMPDENCYAMALDADKAQVDSVTSNAGQCLWTGIVPESRRAALVARMLAPDMFTGFGIRTLAASSGAYNPASYHDGSVWPHDTALVAAGMAAMGFRDAAARVVGGLLDALEAFGGRLPELFCGFDRAEKPVPIPYPTSCSPQAWAAATPFELLRICLGLEVDLPAGVVRATPTPARIGKVEVQGLAAGLRRFTVSADPERVRLTGLPDGVRLEEQGRAADGAAPDTISAASGTPNPATR